jgi:hypothetical protein
VQLSAIHKALTQPREGTRHGTLATNLVCWILPNGKSWKLRWALIVAAIKRQSLLEVEEQEQARDDEGAETPATTTIGQNEEAATRIDCIQHPC